MRNWILCIVSFISLVSAQEQITPQMIERELESAEDTFEKAKKMFNPYYQGPLLTPGASLTKPGEGNLQGYVFVQDTYAIFDKHRNSKSLKSSNINLNPSAYLSYGITDTMDGVFVVQADGNWQFGKSGGGFGDIYSAIGFAISKQSRYVPAIKFTIGETFPTGRYQNLDHNGLGLDATGEGSFQTQFGLATSKLILWDTKHPVNLRWFFGYTVPSKVKVSGFNTFGGGYGTKGTVRPGNVFSTDLGIEISLTQKWVFCTDFVYKSIKANKFSGNLGLDKNGAEATIVQVYRDVLSIAPGFEYSFNPNLGVLFGAWFSVYGRNSAHFASGIISVSYSFP